MVRKSGHMTISVEDSSVVDIFTRTSVSIVANMTFSLFSRFHSNNANSSTHDVKGDGAARGFFVQIVRADWKPKMITIVCSTSVAVL